jgi:translation initiation factor IF-3
VQRPHQRNNRRQNEDLHKINGAITAPVVRLVGDNVTPDIYNLRDAIRLSDELGLDLIEISPTANPPVCKIADYQKFLYDLKKKEKERKAKSTKVEVKEIRLGPNTDDHDFEFKLKHAMKFLASGCKVKVDVFFRGRSIVYKDQGEIILLKFAQQLEEYGKVESMPKLEGKRMIMMLAPLAKKK